MTRPFQHGAWLLVAGALLLPTAQSDGAWGAEIAADRVRAAVETWVRGMTADARADARVVRLESRTLGTGHTIGYVAHLAGGGFCLCGADDRLLPVYLYCPKTDYDPAIPDYADVFAEMQARLAHVVQLERDRDPILQTYEPELRARAADWRELAEGRTPARRGDTRRDKSDRSEPDLMMLPVTSFWSQNSPYNDDCPVLTPGSDEHCVVGCVATALAQILYYWRWPVDAGPGGAYCAWYESRSGDVTNWEWEPLATDPNIPANFAFGRLRWVPDDGGKLGILGYWDDTMYSSARELSEDEDYLDALAELYSTRTLTMEFFGLDFATASYDWSRIYDFHLENDDNTEVARLCYQAGLAVCMAYGIGASSAATIKVSFAYPSLYGYATPSYYLGVDRDTLTADIQWLRPAQIRGSSEAGGHSWVVCGYDKGTDPNRQFLMNMGWGGGSYDWYTLDSIFPNGQEFCGCIAPQDIVKFAGGGGSGDGSPRDPYGDVTEAAAEYPAGATIIFRAGSVNTFAPGGVVFSRSCVLKGLNVVLQPE